MSNRDRQRRRIRAIVAQIFWIAAAMLGATAATAAVTPLATLSFSPDIPLTLAPCTSIRPTGSVHLHLVR